MTEQTYCSKELCLKLEKKGIEASHVMAFEQVSDKKIIWYKNYTLDVVCKWLREVHKLYIEIKLGKNTLCWGYRVSLPNGKISCFSDNMYNTYDEACETAIEYCVDNLI